MLHKSHSLLRYDKQIKNTVNFDIHNFDSPVQGIIMKRITAIRMRWN